MVIVIRPFLKRECAGYGAGRHSAFGESRLAVNLSDRLVEGGVCAGIGISAGGDVASLGLAAELRDDVVKEVEERLVIENSRFVENTSDDSEGQPVLIDLRRGQVLPFL